MVSLLYQQLFVFSFVAAITVVAWSSFIQVESKILEKFGAKSVGCREAFRQRTTPVFLAAAFLFGVSVTSFVTAFILIGYIKPCTPIIQLQPHTTIPTTSHSHTCQGVQTADSVQVDFIQPYLLGKLPKGSKAPVNRLANRTPTRSRTYSPAHISFSLLGRDQHRIRFLSLHFAHVHSRRTHFLLRFGCITVRFCTRVPHFFSGKL